MKNPLGKRLSRIWQCPLLLKYRRPHKKSPIIESPSEKFPLADIIRLKIRPTRAAAGRGGFFAVNCRSGKTFLECDSIMGHRPIDLQLTTTIYRPSIAVRCTNLSQILTRREWRLHAYIDRVVGSFVIAVSYCNDDSAKASSSWKLRKTEFFLLSFIIENR